MIQPILRMGDPRLLEISKPVSDFGTDELKRILEDMRDTMSFNHGAGIAAPQIGVLQRILIFGAKTDRYKESAEVPETTLINPEITILDEATELYWESCLSVEGFRGLVARPKRISYCGYDFEGNFIEREASSFHARVVQHELDHLDGILFPMRVQNRAFLACEDEIGFEQLSEKAMSS